MISTTIFFVTNRLFTKLVIYIQLLMWQEDKQRFANIRRRNRYKFTVCTCVRKKVGRFFLSRHCWQQLGKRRQAVHARL